MERHPVPGADGQVGYPGGTLGHDCDHESAEVGVEVKGLPGRRNVSGGRVRYPGGMGMHGASQRAVPDGLHFTDRRRKLGTDIPARLAVPADGVLHEEIQEVTGRQDGPSALRSHGK